MDDYLDFAKKLARQGGQIIKDNFDTNFEVELKSDNTPVTRLDTAINDLISRAIQKAYPDHGLLGEEGDHGNGQEDYQWICDPIDGTKAFVISAPLSTCIIGLTKRGQTQLAVIYDPFMDRLYHAVRGQGAYCNGQLIKVNQQPLPGGTVLVSESSFQFVPGLKVAGAQVEPLPGGGYRLALLASGRCSGCLQTQAAFHDVGVGALIVEEAGGMVTDINGKPYERYDRPLQHGVILSNGLVHDELVKIAQIR